MSFYPRLPDELKLQIWEKAMTLEHGAFHHFKIRFWLPREYGQTLVVFPHTENVNNDPSSWVDLRRLSLASRMSWDLIEKSNHADRVLFWQKAPPRHVEEAAFMGGLPASKGTAKTPQEELDAVNRVLSRNIPSPTQAFINGDQDIVCFTVVGSDFDLGWLHMENNRRRFRHVNNVAFNYFRPVAKPERWVSSPFECDCGHACTGGDGAAGFCTYAMCSFLRIFRNLKNVYFTIPITALRLGRPAPETRPRGTKRSRGGQAINKPGSQLVAEAMDKFKTIAQEKGLSIFQDYKTTYYEVDESGLSTIKGCHNPLSKLDDLEVTWDAVHMGGPLPGSHNPGADWPDVQFRFLVYQGR